MLLPAAAYNSTGHSKNAWYLYCESLIDDFKSETIGSDKLNLAETTVINLKSKTNNKEIEKLHALIQEAIKKGTQISFDF